MSAGLLIIDDDPEMRAYLALALADRVRALSAADGGASDWPDGPPALLLLDLLLGDNGERAEGWLARARAARVPVVLMTGLPPEDPRVLRALAGGGVELLPKPFDLGAVRARVSGRT